MSLSLTTRRRLQTSSTKWSSQQHIVQPKPETLIRQNRTQSMQKQKSFIETSSTASGRRCYIQRGISVGRSQDLNNQRVYARQLLKKHYSSKDDHEANSINGSAAFPRKNTLACGSLRTVQTSWSSTSSILKSLDKELASLNGVLAKTKDVKTDNSNGASNYSTKVVSSNNAKIKNDSVPLTANSKAVQKFPSTSSNFSNKTHQTQLNKVNLSIVLSHALNDNKEHDSLLSDQADDDEGASENSECENLGISSSDTKGNNKAEAISKIVPTQRRLALCQSMNSSSTLSSPLTTSGTAANYPCNFNASPSLTIQKRPPLVRAMSAPVRSYEDNSKGTFLGNKRKPRRRKLNGRTVTCDKDKDDHLLTPTAKDLNLASKQKILQRSRSVAPDVITLVSLVSSEGSDSEKEDYSTTPVNSDCSSPTRRAPNLRKAGKSVSFQENYPPTFQFASKEYSHMLRRGSIAPLAARIKSNRPPTAPPVSIFHSNNCNSTSKKTMDQHDRTTEEINKLDSSLPMPETSSVSKKSEEEESYHYPEYVRSIKERECWKLYQKMATKGVHITYDTILRGMLTPTEFRQLQKQREMEEAKALKECEELAALEEEQQKPRSRLTAVAVGEKTDVVEEGQ